MVVLSSYDQFLQARHKNYLFANWKEFACERPITGRMIKVFDHQILLSKLETYGIRANAHSLITSYLSIYLAVNNMLVSWEKIQNFLMFFMEYHRGAALVLCYS